MKQSKEAKQNSKIAKQRSKAKKQSKEAKQRNKAKKQSKEAKQSKAKQSKTIFWKSHFCSRPRRLWMRADGFPLNN